MRTALAFMALSLLMVSCAFPSTAVPTRTSTLTPSPSTAAEPTFAPSSTPEPTLTLVPSPSASATASPSQAPVEAGTYDCTLRMQSVVNGAHYQRGEQFSIGWKVRNTGTVGWVPGTVDFTYIAGTKMYQYPLVQLKGTVSPGNIAILIADLRAPTNPGKYSTTWSLRQGENYFCHVSLTIYVD